MPRYVDGFVIPLPKKYLALYKKIASNAGKIWREHGALEYRECVIEDLNPMGMPGFPVMAKVKKNETVVFAWIVYKSRAHRDRVNKKVMADPRIHKGMDPNNPPFDCKRMAYGGFTVLVDR
ncbi:MAG TPA: DUF1428 domain-containing protein [Planctomycetota bacterium]|jgi:uncharacterized protein YbaA (DUF1428 family)|nr:DUF1428 domain-containing protein [Planctomycetota bacterium]